MFKKYAVLALGILLAPLCFASTLDNKEFTTWLEINMREQNIPAVSIAIVKDYDVAEVKAFGRKQAGTTQNVDAETAFQVGELTRPLSATLALKTSHENLMKLSAPVNRFLTSWRMPDNQFSRRRALTPNRILNGSSGTNVANMQSYSQGQAIPTLIQMLEGQKPARNESVQIIETPGVEHKDTVGGYLVLQKVLEDIHQKPFATLMQEKVFTPLEMTQSSVTNAPQNIAMPHSSRGFAMEGGPRIYPALAADALWTTPKDLAKWMASNQKSFSGNPDQLLHPKMAKKLFNANFKTRGPDAYDYSDGLIANVDRFGNKQQKGQYFYLTGKTQGYQALLIGNKYNGNGAVIMINKAMTAEQDKSVELHDILAKIVEHEQWQDKAETPARA